MNSPSGKSKRTLTAPATGTVNRLDTVRLLTVAAIVAFAVFILCNSMTKDVGRDEQMYCTAGVLLAKGQMIYRDFSYPSQLPCHPLLLAALYRILGTTHYLLVGRLVSVVCDIVTVIGILCIYRTIFPGHRRQGSLFGLAAVTLYVFNPIVDYATGYAWNHDVVIACVVLSLWVLIATDFQARSRFWRMAVIGGLLTIATFMRITTSLAELLFLGAVLWIAGGTVRNRIATALPFVAAAIATALGPLWIIAQAPQAFRLNLVRIPTLYGQWLHEMKMTFDKLALTVISLGTPGYLVLLALVGYLLWMSWRHSSSLEAVEKRKAVLAALLPLVFFVVAYIPPTMWQQYLAVPVPFIVAAFAYPLAALCRGAGKPEGRGRYKLAGGLVGVGAIVVVFANPVVLSRSLAVLVPENWTPVQLHRMSREIAARISEPRLVLTLGPLYAVEGGGDIYPELAAGSIIYRIADRLSPEERELTHTVGPKTLPGLVATHPPAAVIAGVERSPIPKLDRIGQELEEPLQRAVPPDWRKATYGDRLQVYTRP